MFQNFISIGNIDFFKVAIVLAVYILPIPLSVIALRVWHHYKKEMFIAGIKWALLEIHVPRDIVKTPAAMELIFSNAFYHKSGKDFLAKYLRGETALWFSLEIVSIDGKVHFFVRTPTRIRDLVETQIYAQYPQAKVVEVEDYVFDVPRAEKKGDWNVWGCEFAKAKEDFFPIKTYKDFGTDFSTGMKEEFKIDPITATLEYLGGVPKGQQIWLQILVRHNAKKYISKVTGKKIGFSEAATEFMFDMLKPYTNELKNEVDGKISMKILTTVPEPVRPIVASVSNQINKLHYDCGIRMMVLSDKRVCTDEQFNNLRRSSRLIFRQYAQPAVNELDRVNSVGLGSFWSDPTGLAINKIKNRMLNFYRTRTFFDPPLQYSGDYPSFFTSFFTSGKPKVFVFSSEELATIFHFPGMVSETPSFKRIESKIAKPPSNLPI